MTVNDHDSASTGSVALSMLTLVPGAMGGSERYARALTRELPREAVDLDVTAVVPRSAAGFSAGVREHVVDAIEGGDGTRQRLTAMVRAQLLRRTVPALERASVHHFPFTVPTPYVAAVRRVVTLHDVQHLELPELFSRPERLFRHFAYDKAAQHADAVITVSDFTKRRAIELLGLDARRVHVAHLGVAAVAPADVLRARDNFVLYPARGWSHKNHSTLIRAVELLRRNRRDMRLVLTGGGLEALDALPDWVQVRGHVSDRELDALYRSAACLAFPSLYEGFGMPPLEAMLRGCPVAVSDRAALPEICGDAAVYFDAMDPSAIARAIADAIDHGQTLASRGIDHASKFTWSQCARLHGEVYRSLLEVG